MFRHPVMIPRAKREINTDAANNNGLSNGVSGNLPEEFPDTANGNGLIPEKAGENHTDTFYQGLLEKFRRQIDVTPGALSISTTVLHVRHYAEYTIEVYACHDPDPLKNNTTLCSRTAVTSARTKQKGVLPLPFNSKTKFVCAVKINSQMRFNF